MSKLKFSPFSEKQLTVLSWWHPESSYCDFDGLICDGAVRSGKTLCMSISFVAWSFFAFNETSFAISGKTVQSVRRNIVTPILPILRQLGFVCSEKLSKNEITITYGKRTNRFFLFGGKDEASASLIQGMTLGGVLFDEVALMPRSFVEQAIARCSLEGAKFWFNCNPENPQHWFKKEWIEKCHDKNCLHLHFRMQDNPSLSKKVIERYESLYSGTFYERFVEGKWVAAEGIVYPQFSEKVHVCSPPPEPFEKYYISCDYGTVNPSSFGLWGRKDGIWYRIEEYYHDSRREGVQKTDEEHYSSLEKLASGREIEGVIVDPSAASFIQCISRHGTFRPIPAKNQVIDGIRLVSDCLKAKKIMFSPLCRDSIREFSLYRWDSSSSKDAVRKENDHAMDDIRYFVSTVLEKNENEFFVFSTERR
ncbi:MAG: PBSX family phage terminase large subunit [Ruminococcaceae bacterium]|nr:PBSX family phage terminase large subunit [Oscillospiraceae bacterium]